MIASGAVLAAVDAISTTGASGGGASGRVGIKWPNDLVAPDGRKLAGVLAQVAQLLGDAGASIKSVVQQGLGERAQLMMVTHPLAHSRLAVALEQIARLEHVRSPPRAIAVINEEFV